jgi:predicted acetyltransferase
MAEVEIAVAGADQLVTVQNLFQLYVHDFSEQWAGQPRGEVGADGRFDLGYPLDSYWREPERVPLLIQADGQLAGFALLNVAGHVGQPLDRNMAEFFVLRKHRRGGVGRAAAQAIFSRYPGVWEAAVARRNAGALAFWRRAIREHPAASGLQEVDLSGPDWDGPVLRFSIRG